MQPVRQCRRLSCGDRMHACSVAIFLESLTQVNIVFPGLVGRGVPTNEVSSWRVLVSKEFLFKDSGDWRGKINIPSHMRYLSLWNHQHLL